MNKSKQAIRKKQYPLVHVRVPAALKQSAEKQADEEGRTLTEVVRNLLRKWVEKKVEL